LIAIDLIMICDEADWINTRSLRFIQNKVKELEDINIKKHAVTDNMRKEATS